MHIFHEHLIIHISKHIFEVHTHTQSRTHTHTHTHNRTSGLELLSRLKFNIRNCWWKLSAFSSEVSILHFVPQCSSYNVAATM